MSVTAATPLQDAAPFLTDAAHLLKVSAPETSAHLMLHCTDLYRRNAMPMPETHRQHVCGACGHIMVPGFDASKVNLEHASYRAKKSRVRPPNKAEVSKSATTSKSLQKQIRCGRCSRTTSVKLDEPPKAARPRRQKPQAVAETAPTSSNSVNPPTTKNTSNATSKKRAKNRKAGLQSLLAAGQGQKSKSLSLSDFMR